MVTASTVRRASLWLGAVLAATVVAAGFAPGLGVRPVAAPQPALAAVTALDATSAAPAGTGTVRGSSPGMPDADAAALPSPDELLAQATAATGVPAASAAVTVTDLTDRTTASWGDPEPQITASIVKVDILATLLLQRQDEGRTLSANERSLAFEMITESDNDAATALWEEIGGADGLADANVRLGLTGTAAGSGGYWGLTRTTPADQVRLLVALTSPTSALDASSRSYVLSLMSEVDPDQAWGVSAAGSAALKNGWLDRPDGTWTVNSIGVVTTTDDRELLVAVLSHGWESMEAGVAAVERLAAAAVTV